MERIRMINLAISTAGMAVSLVGLIQTFGSRHMEKHTKTFFIAFFGILSSYVCANIAVQLLEGHTGSSGLLATKIAVFLASAFAPFLALVLTEYLLHSTGEKHRRTSMAFRIAAEILLVYLFILVHSLNSGYIYYLNSSGYLQRGERYYVLLIPPMLIMLLNLVLFLRRRKMLNSRQRIAVNVYLIVPVASILVQVLIPGVYFIVLGTSLSGFVMFTYLFQDQVDLYCIQEQENASLRMDIMLSQIKPHFLYNSLGAIEELCDSDPKAAKAATSLFSRYLRGNMNSLSAEGAIPFEKELSHTKLYLELEKLRFEDALQVRYDIECTDFSLPTLTLEPLAENAVRHGVREKETGEGCVTIASREYPDRYEVTVTDDGPGFDVNAVPDDGHIHLGIKNVRDRLERVCGGMLRIESEPGRGTAATIIIPKERDEE